MAIPQIFISHTETDAELALGIALGLEQAGYRIWSYKRDSLGALSYLAQIKRAIENCKALVLVISPSTLKSNQVGIEVIRAHELNKRFVPVLHGLTHEDFRKQEPEWGGVLGAATAIELRRGDPSEAVPRILAGLKAIGIEPDEPEADRIATVREALEVARAPRATQESPAPAVVSGATHAEAASRRGRLLLLGLSALALLVAAALTWQRREQPPREDPVVREKPAGPIVVGVMDFEAQGLGQDDEWMPRSTRDSFNTILSNVQEVRVYAKEKIDFLCNKRALDLMECADKLAMSKVVRGKLWRSSNNITLEVRVIDIQTGFLDLSFEGSRPAGDIIALQNDLAMELLQKLGIEVNDQRRETLLASRTSDAADSIKLLSETLSDYTGKDKSGASLSNEPNRHLASLLQWHGVAYALAAEAGDSPGAADASDEAAIRDVLQRYGAAIQAKDMGQLALVLADLNSQQRSAHERYFESAEDLAVEISDLDVLIEGDEALATFTRKDSFKESKSGRDRTLEVRLNSLLKKEDGAWKITSFAK